MKLGSSGKPIRNVQVKIENKTGEYVNGYEVGEIVVSGPNVMQGYYKDFEKQRKLYIPENCSLKIWDI